MHSTSDPIQLNIPHKQAHSSLFTAVRARTHPADTWMDLTFSQSESFQEWNLTPDTLHLTSPATQHRPPDPWGCFILTHIFRYPIRLCTFP